MWLRHFICLLGLTGMLSATERQWPFTPVKKPAAPNVRDGAWGKNGIDPFVLARLETKGVVPAAETGRRALARRVFFDLIGLPPSPEEMERFLKDTDSRAYEKLVDRLLADKRFGEKWARLWMDLARYADTAGYEGDPDLPHAWRYRDYVIDAFNNDKPYDQFIKEQIAGDEFANIMGAGDLPKVKPERIVAMTFLRLAPFTEPRGDETRHEMLSEMTATVSSVFLGLTVGCAQCHDHKYDAIPTADFYRMQAFFSTVQIPRPLPGDGYQIGGPIPAAFYRKGENEWAARKREEFNAATGRAKTELTQLTAALRAKLGQSSAGFGLQSMGGALGNNYVYAQQASNDGKLHTALVNADGGWTFYTDGQRAAKTGKLAGGNTGHWFGHLPTLQHLTLGQHTAGKGTPAGAGHQGRFAEVLLYDHPLNEAERAALQTYVATRYTKGKPASPPQQGLRFWLDAGDLDADPNTPNPPVGGAIREWVDKVGKLKFAQAEPKLQPKLGTLGAAPAVKFSNHFLKADAAKAVFRKDKRGSIFVIFSATHQGEGYGFEAGGKGAFLSTVSYPDAGKKNSLEAAINNPDHPAITGEERARYRQLKNAGNFIKQRLKRLEPQAMSLRHSYGPPYEPGVPVTRIMIRGEHDNPGPVVQAGFPSVVTGHGKPAKLRMDPFHRWPTRSRRMALAEWIASPNNPLTARVMANRLWHWHFGRGIVVTPSDFGKLSGGASHPELLDWLAHELVTHRWSLKHLHRLIVTSAAYRQGTAISPATRKADPENKLFSRFERRRLTGEELRDAVLATSGRLNPEQHGLPIFPPLPDGIEEDVKYNQSKWDTQFGPESHKRSLYIYQQRTLAMPFLQTFDALVCDESRPRRRASVTPLQALALANGRLVHTEAAHFAARIRKTAGDDPSAQITAAFQLAFARPADAAEQKHFTAFLKASPEKNPLFHLCRVLLNANEFSYLD